MLRKKPVRKFRQLTKDPRRASEIEEFYGGQIDQIDQVDLMVGLFGEPLPPGFGFSDTAFRIFILMASRRRFWSALVWTLHPDPLGIHLLSRFRRRYGATRIMAGTRRRPLLLLLDSPSISTVLDGSPAVYADPKAKRRGMSRFQPDAVTISRDSRWTDRRRFNETGLGFHAPRHPLAERFLEVVVDECRRVDLSDHRVIRWQDLERLFDHVTLRIIFGRGAREDLALLQMLRSLMRNGNRSFLPPRRQLLQAFQAAIAGYLKWPETGSLTEQCRGTDASSVTAVERQIPHWLFAMSETLAANTARALTVVAALPELYQRAAEELANFDPTSGSDVARMRFLAGCLQEAMRLWPTTPLLSREVIRPGLLGGESLRMGTQILIPTPFINRVSAGSEDLSEFRPERWESDVEPAGFLHLSQGAQICAGKPLGLLIGTAVLACLLKTHQFHLQNSCFTTGRLMPEAVNYFRLRFATCLRTRTV